MGPFQNRHLIWRSPYRTVAITPLGSALLFLSLAALNVLLYWALRSLVIPGGFDLILALTILVISGVKRWQRRNGVRLNFKRDDEGGSSGIFSRIPISPGPRRGADEKPFDIE